jgi:hypothetical protein
MKTVTIPIDDSAYSRTLVNKDFQIIGVFRQEGNVMHVHYCVSPVSGMIEQTAISAMRDPLHTVESIPLADPDASEATNG